MVSHALLSTDARFFLFPASLVAQVLVGAIGNTPTIWVHGVGDISAAVILSRRNPGEPTNLHRPRVDLGHILSMGGLGWAPDDAEIINTGMTRWNCRPGHALGCAGRVHRESCQGRQSTNLHTLAVL